MFLVFYKLWPCTLIQQFSGFMFLHMAFIDKIESLITPSTSLQGLCNKLTLNLHNIAFQMQIKLPTFLKCLFFSLKGISCWYSQLQTPDKVITALYLLQSQPITSKRLYILTTHFHISLSIGASERWTSAFLSFYVS